MERGWVSQSTNGKTVLRLFSRFIVFLLQLFRLLLVHRTIRSSRQGENPNYVEKVEAKHEGVVVASLGVLLASECVFNQ